MKKSFKLYRVILTILCAAMLATVFGCSQSGGKTQTPQANAPAQTAANAEKPWKPERPVTVVCWSSAGGGTDLQSRAMAKALEKEMGVSFQVVNMTGGGGGVAANNVFSQKRDGYTILGMSEGVHGIPVLGTFDKTSDAFELMMVLSSQGVISVSADSPYKTIEDLIAAAKSKTLKSSSSQAGSIWTLKLLQFEKSTGVKFNHLPYEGSQPSHVAALNGEVDVVVTAFAEQKEYILAKKLRPLAAIDTEGIEFPGIDKIPALADKFPKFKELPPVMMWVGMGMPSDTPENIKKAYRDAWAKAVKSKEVEDLAKTTGFKILGYSSSDPKTKELLKKMDSSFAWTLKEEGLATKSPELFNIPKP